MLSHTDGAALEALQTGKCVLLKDILTGIPQESVIIPPTFPSEDSGEGHHWATVTLAAASTDRLKWVLLSYFSKSLFTLHRIKSIKWQLVPICFKFI